MSGVEIVGTLGLAGLFNNAIDWFKYVYVAKQHEARLQTHFLKLDNALLRLTRWGEAVGLSDCQVDDESVASELSETQRERAKQLFRDILHKFEACKALCDNEKKGKTGVEEITPFSNPSASNSGKRYIHDKLQRLSSRRRNGTKLSEKVKFAIYKDTHLTQMTDDINRLIDDLYALYPPPDEKQADLSRHELQELLEVLRTASDVAVKTGDTTLASGLQQILNQQNTMRFDNRNTTIQTQGVKSGGSDRQNVYIAPRRY